MPHVKTVNVSAIAAALLFASRSSFAGYSFERSVGDRPVVVYDDQGSCNGPGGDIVGRERLYLK